MNIQSILDALDRERALIQEAFDLANELIMKDHATFYATMGNSIDLLQQGHRAMKSWLAVYDLSPEVKQAVKATAATMDSAIDCLMVVRGNPFYHKIEKQAMLEQWVVDHLVMDHQKNDMEITTL